MGSPRKVYAETGRLGQHSRPPVEGDLFGGLYD
jgi:hypothetical protein